MIEKKDINKNKSDYEKERLIDELIKVREDLEENHELQLWWIADERVFELEKERLWPNIWHFVVHESEIPKPGDFVVRAIGPTDEVLAIRGQDNKIRIFLNMCSHRGLKLVKAEKGNSKFITCPYHGWTFNGNGKLIGVPLESIAYGELDKERYGLLELKSESYAGFVFSTLNENPEPLENYLGEIKWYMDILFRRNSSGYQFFPPERRIIKFNWKMGADSFVHDVYHFVITHKSASSLYSFEYIKNIISGYQIASKKGHNIRFLGKDGKGRGFPAEFFPILYPIWEPAVVEEAKKLLEPKQFELFSLSYHISGLVFPNLGFFNGIRKLPDVDLDYPKSVGIPHISFRLLRPINTDTTEYYNWFVVEKDADEEFKNLSYRTFMNGFGAGGVVETDDIEHWTMITKASKYSTNFTRKIKVPYKLGDNLTSLKDFMGPHGEELDIIPTGLTEKSARYMWRRILDYLIGE